MYRVLAPVRKAFLALAMAFLFVANAFAQCSGYIGLATINEVNGQKANEIDEFLEVKVLGNSIDTSVTEQWTVTLCSDQGKGNNAGPVCDSASLSGSDYYNGQSVFPYLVLENTAIDVSLINFKDGFDLLLTDALGNAIDYLYVNGYQHQLTLPSCAFSYPISVNGTTNGTKFIERSPDGTGDWQIQQGNNNDPSPGDGNDGGVVSYQLKITDASALEGKPITFDIGLFDENDQPVNATEDITFLFNTQDNTAIAANGHYDGFVDYPMTLTSGNSTTQFSVNTYYTDEADEIDFLAIISKVNDSEFEDIVIDSTATGTIRQFTFVSANYHLDECTYNNQADDVIDYSSNNRHGTALNSVQNTTQGAINSGASFLFPTGQPEISTQVPLNNGWTISAWVKIAPESSYFPQPLFAQDNNNALFRFVTLFTPWGGLGWSVGSFDYWGNNTPDIDIKDGSWHHLVIIGDADNNSTQLYVDKVFHSQINDYVGNELTKIGEETLTVVFWQDSFSFDNDLDEVIVFDGIISQEEIDTIYDNQSIGREFYGEPRSESPCGGDVYYQLIHSAQGLTCEAEEVRIQTCTLTGCTDTGSDTILFTVNDAQGQVISESINLAEGNIVSYRYTQEADVVISVANTGGVDLSPVCVDDIGGNSCQTSFSNAGFIFSGLPSLNESFIAGDGFPLSMQAVKDNDGVCVPYITGDTPINFSLQYVAPAQATQNQYVITGVNGAQEIPAAVGEINGADVALAFDNQGSTSFDNVYYDAGQVSLHAIYTDAEGAQISGSAIINTRPAAFSVSANSEAGLPLEDASLTIVDANVQKAGIDFELALIAQNRQGDTTTNYQSQQIELETNLVLPSPSNGGFNGVLTFPQGYTLTTGSGYQSISSNSSLFTDGEMRYSQASFSEVGYINLAARDTNYSTNGTITTPYPITLGRFTPAYLLQHLEVDGGVEHGSLGYSSGQGFAYVGAEFGYASQPQLGLVAMNGLNQTTKNYSGNFMRLSSNGVVINEPVADQQKTNLDGQLMPLAQVTITNTTPNDLGEGEVEYIFSAIDSFTYSRDRLSAVTPFNGSILLEVESITDEDGVGAIYRDEIGVQAPLLSPLVEGGNEFMRYGRVRLENSFGTETAVQRMSALAEYLTSGGTYVTNSIDSASILDISSSSNYVITTALSDINVACPALDASPDNNTCPIYDTCSTTSNYINGLNQTISLQKCNDDRGQLTFELEVPLWLKYNWSDESGEPDENPSAVATFGQYRGNDRVIYRRDLSNGN